MCMAIVPAIVRTEPVPTPKRSMRLDRPLAQPRMRRQAEIVVRGEVDDRAAVEGRVRALLVLEHPQVAVDALRLERVDFGVR